MNNSIMVILSILPMIAILNLLSNRYHLLMTLLSLEGVMLSLVLFVPLCLYSTSISSIMLSVIMLTLGACEASLGLSLMVRMSRSYGTDMLQTLTTSKC